MSKLKPKVEWVHNPRWWTTEYGLLCLAGKWAVVRARDDWMDGDYEVITAWLDDRITAIGFLKLLLENES
jgi:hypothetical protein